MVLVAHVSYRQRGGEDAVVDTEVRLLREAGHDVTTLIVQSGQFSALRKTDQVGIGAHLGDHSYGRKLIREAIECSRPEVVHFHNLYPMLGPGALREASRLGCATVQTFHNYRLSCIAGTHYRAGNICEQCSPRCREVGVLRGCYRESRLQSLAMAGGVAQQWRMLCGARIPDAGICLTKFMRDRLMQAGAPGDALTVKPNSVDAAQRVVGWGERRGAVFVGRLSPEKGIAELVQAWPRHAPMLKVIGTGPLLARVKATAGPNVLVLGEVATDQVRSHLSAARVCVIPSMCLEGLPRVGLEAFAEGTPVIGFTVGALAEALAQQGPGLGAARGEFEALCEIATAWTSTGERDWTAASSNAQSLHAAQYGHASNVASLEALYGLASDRAKGCGE
jgi:glycosyltransferase involved in cell wall biosynthesis